ncbi:unnamed protein product, partial [Iphiclides podalirius]
MEDFQRELHKGNPVGPSTSSIATEFSSFKKFILAALTTPHSQMDLVVRELDRNEMRRRIKTILLHVFSRYHRLGRPSDKEFRPVVVKFHESSFRDKVWFSKTELKGSGIQQSKFLTKSRHNVFMEAWRRYGVTKCWAQDGVIHLFTPDGTCH